MPLQFLNFGEVLLLFTYFEFYHYNYSSIWNMPRYTSGIRMEKHWAQLQRTQHYHIFVWTKLPLPPLLSLRHWRMDPLVILFLPSFAVFSMRPWQLLSQLPRQRSSRRQRGARRRPPLRACSRSRGRSSTSWRRARRTRRPRWRPRARRPPGATRPAPARATAAPPPRRVAQARSLPPLLHRNRRGAGGEGSSAARLRRPRSSGHWRIFVRHDFDPDSWNCLRGFVASNLVINFDSIPPQISRESAQILSFSQERELFE